MTPAEALKVVIDSLEFSVPEAEYDVCHDCGMADWQAGHVEPFEHRKVGVRGHYEHCRVALAIETLKEAVK